MGEKSSNQPNQEELSARKLSRRKAISTIAGASIGVVVGAAVAGSIGYYAGLQQAPKPAEKVTTQTVTTAQTVTERAAPVQELTLSLFEPSGAASPVTNEFNKMIIKAWNNEHPNYKIDYKPTPFGVLYNKIVSMYQGGTAPNVYMAHAIWYYALAKLGVSRALEDFLTPEQLEDSRKYYHDAVFWDQTFAGKHWGIPRVSGPHNLYYSTDILEEAGVSLPKDKPLTYSEFFDVSKQLTNPAKDIIGFGYANDLAAVDRPVYFAYMLKNWADVDLVDWSDPKRPKPNFTNPAVSEAMEWLAKLVRETSIGEKVSTYTLAQMQTLFAQKKAATVLEGQYFNQWMLGLNPKLRFSAVPYPSNLTNKWYAGMDPTHFWTVSTSEKNPQVAYQFIRFFTNLVNDRMIAIETGWYPVAKENVALPNPRWSFHSLFSLPSAKFYMTRWLPGPEGARIAAEKMNEVFLGKKPARDVMRETQEQLEKIWPKYLM